MEKIYRTVQDLCPIPSPGGMELSAAKALAEYCTANYSFDEVRYIPTGTVLCYLNSKNKDAKTLLFDAHFDEIGFMVTGVFDDGFLAVTRIGGIDTRVLSASEVTVYGKEVVKGVFTSKPPHLQVPGEQKKKIDLSELFIDTGLEGNKLKELVKIGDCGVMNGACERLQNNRIVSRAFDDKACVAIILRAIDLLKDRDLGVNICCQFSASEETGYVGAATGTYSADPDYAVVLDVCNPRFPEGDKTREHVDLGKGSIISYSGTTCRSFTTQLINCAKSNGFKYELKADPGRTGTNSQVVAIAREGVPTALISLALRYMHTASEVIDLGDCLEISKLIAEFAIELGGNNND